MTLTLAHQFISQLDEEIRETLARLKNGLLVNRDIKEVENFEI